MSSVRTAFGLPKPILGAPLVIARTAWVLFPLTVVGVTVQLVSSFLTRDVPPFWTPERADRVILLMTQGRPVEAVHLAHDSINAWLVRVGMDEIMQLVGVSLVVAAATYQILGRDARLSTLLRFLLRKAVRLFAIWFVSRGIVACIVGAGALMILSSEHRPHLLMWGAAVMFVGATAGLVSVLLLFAALPIVVVEHATVPRSLARSSLLALRRMPAAIGTVALVFLTSWLVGVVVGGGTHLVAAGIETSWPVLGIRHGVSAALSTAMSAVLYLLRYLDTRARKEGYGRADLAIEFGGGPATTPRATPA
ncbi:MAG: hypothetical protein J2P14_03285 [Acidothermales bacterium]|nr:hypothetical protein [Acidothermales bacterium]